MVQRSLVLTLALSLLAWQGTPFAGRAAAAAAAVVPVDGGWPRAYTTGSGARLVLYEPQVASWADEKRIVMYAAVSYRGRNEQTPALGTLRIEADTKISLDERLVNFPEFTITASNFPTMPREQQAAVLGEISSSVPCDERVIGLDRVLAAVDTSQVKPRNVDGVKADPPAVFYSTVPAVLVNLDGDPIWSPMKDGDLRFALNTSWDLFEHMPSRSYFLRTDSAWMKAVSIDGPWTAAGKLPDSFSRLPDDGRWKDARAGVARHAPGGPAPGVFMSRKPAEMILLRGAPVYAAVSGTGLLWVSNTRSDIFRAGKTGPVYYLVSGRWFTAPDFKGPWTFATPNLPEDFKRIPREHPRSHVLASVPNTTQAFEAVLLAQVPQTARVSRARVAAPEAVYQGEPQFQPIEYTSVARAVNTDKDILKVGDLYYLCVDGVWFMSRSASGPWTLSDSIPDEIYEIPISSPAYHVTNVTVENADDEAVVFATDAAYTGVVVAWGCAVWGTGWSHPPYVGWHGDSLVYYPRSPSYGDAARYNPKTGTYLSGVAHASHPRPGTVAQLQQGANVYGSWGATAVQRGDRRAQASQVTIREAGPIGRTGGDNVFAGHDGNVYRIQGRSWQKYDHSAWISVVRPMGTGGELGAAAGKRLEDGGLLPGTRDQLDRDLAARRNGHQRLDRLTQ
jgi:hypothetical protein